MALDISPKQTINLFTMGNVLSAKGDVELAALHFETALKEQPGFEMGVHTLRTIRCASHYEAKVREDSSWL
jgi:hypothetical protein